MFNPADLPTSASGNQEESYLAAVRELKQLNETNVDEAAGEFVSDIRSHSDHRRSDIISVTPYVPRSDSLHMRPAGEGPALPPRPLSFLERQRLSSDAGALDEQGADYLQPLASRTFVSYPAFSPAPHVVVVDEEGYMQPSQALDTPPPLPPPPRPRLASQGPAVTVLDEDAYLQPYLLPGRTAHPDPRPASQTVHVVDEEGYLQPVVSRANKPASKPAIVAHMEDSYLQTYPALRAPVIHEEPGYLQVSHVRGGAGHVRAQPSDASQWSQASDGTQPPSFDRPYLGYSSPPAPDVDVSYPPPVLYAEGGDDPEGVVPEFEDAAVDYDAIQATRPVPAPRSMAPAMLRSYYPAQPLVDPEYDPPSDA